MVRHQPQTGLVQDFSESVQDSETGLDLTWRPVSDTGRAEGEPVSNLVCRYLGQCRPNKEPLLVTG